MSHAISLDFSGAFQDRVDLEIPVMVRECSVKCCICVCGRERRNVIRQQQKIVEDALKRIFLNTPFTFN